MTLIDVWFVSHERLSKRLFGSYRRANLANDASDRSPTPVFDSLAIDEEKWSKMEKKILRNAPISFT